MFYVLFYLLFILLISGHYHLDVLLFEKIQDYKEKALSSSKQEARQVTLNHLVPICFLSYTHWLACINTVPKPHTLGIVFILG
jgi:hypothetical protein